MSDQVGAKAISLVTNDRITEDRTARVFHATGSRGEMYTVVISSHSPVCTCAAGRNGRRCYHVEAARLLMARERSAKRSG